VLSTSSVSSCRDPGAVLAQTKQLGDMSLPGLGTVHDDWLLPLGLVAIALLALRSVAVWHLNP
jgi:hypothetical protein